MAPSRARLAFLASALTRPPLRSRAAPSRPTSRNGRSTPALLLRTLSPQPPSPSGAVAPAALVRSSSRGLFSTDPSPTPSSAAAPDGSKAAGGPEPPDYLSEGERAVFEKVKRELKPSRLEVQDISGGCGSMYAIEIVASRFEGMSVVRQHRLVNEVLKEEIARWHGVQLKTRAE